MEVILSETRINITTIITTLECPEILSEVCELVDCLKPKASHLCPDSCPRGKNRIENVILYDSYYLQAYVAAFEGENNC